MAKYAADLSFQLAYAGFTRVMADNIADGLFSDLAVFLCQTVFGKFTPDQVTQGDLGFFLFRITRDLDHFQSVA